MGCRDRLALAALALAGALAARPACADPPIGVTQRTDTTPLRGVDVALGSEYEPGSFNLVPELVTHVAAAITIAHTRIAAQVAYGHGITDDERFGDARLSALHPITHALAAGLDARATLDLEIDNSEPPGEEEWNLRAGPAATLALGPVTAGALVGASAVKLRAEAAGHAGAVAEVGLTARF